MLRMSQDDNAREEENTGGEPETQEIEPKECIREDIGECTGRLCKETDSGSDAFILVDHARFLLFADHEGRNQAMENITDIKNEPGELLVVTEDASLLFALRERISGLEGWTLRWENHFWTALASLPKNRYAGLVLDMRISSLEEKYILDFVQEYSKRSDGLKLFLSGSNTSNTIKRMLKRQGSIVLKGQHHFESLIKLFGLDK